MQSLSRRDFLSVGLAASAGLVAGSAAEAKPASVHEQILDLALKQQEQRRARFAAVKTKGELEALQQSLRQKFLDLLDCSLPGADRAPTVTKLGKIEADDYTIEKLVFETFPGYFVSALLYRPKPLQGAHPGILSPCGHSATGKAADPYQLLHINLAQRGYVVLTYDPVGQGERSQFWDADKGKSRFNLSCGEHAVLGNPMYLMGTSLARYRIWDGMRGLDYLTSLPEVDAQKIGCVGNSGGGTLTSYISALDPRVSACVIGCYITTLPRRMGNRIQKDPSADPEQDIFGFVSEGIDHAGLLALRVPKPTLLASAKFDFFPIEGTRESYAEAKRLYEVVGAGERIGMVEAEEKHGMTLPLRLATYAWFDRWLTGKNPSAPVQESSAKPRPAKDLLVCKDGQVNVTFKSEPLLLMAMRHLAGSMMRLRQPQLKNLLRLDPELTDYHLSVLAEGGKANQTLVLLLNGNEAGNWQEEREFVQALATGGCTVKALDVRGVGKLRPNLEVKGHPYADPLNGVEENIAYNAFLVGKSLIGMRVTDVLSAVKQETDAIKPARIVLCGRRDAALVACFAAAVEPAITHLAMEEMPLSYMPFLQTIGRPINAASILPGLLRTYGDWDRVISTIAPRKVLAAAATAGTLGRKPESVQVIEESWSKKPALLLEWLN